MKNKLLVVLPAYNEEGNVEQMIRRWIDMEHKIATQHNLGLEIAVVNDGSSDETARICKLQMQRYANVTLINHVKNKGLGMAVNTGIQYGINGVDEYKYLCIMDCDNTQDPKYILNMLTKIEQQRNGKELDVVIASRYQKGASVYGLSKYRRFISDSARIVFKIALPIRYVRDYTCGYRLYRVSTLKKAQDTFGESIIEENGFTCMVELLYKLRIIKATFGEVPFDLHYEAKVGDSKMKVMKTATRSILLALHLRRLNFRKNK